MRYYMRSTTRVSISLYKWRVNHFRHSSFTVRLCSSGPAKSDPKTKNNLWTFLWGSAQETVKTQPTLIQDILEYKVKATEVSPFEYVLVNTSEKLDGTIKLLEKHKLLAVDCEGVGLSREGKLCLVQIGIEKVVFLIDVVTLGQNTFTTGIGKILQDPEVTKVMHDCRADSDALFHQYDIKLQGMYHIYV